MKDRDNPGENAIAAFSFAGLTFPGGEMPARLICQPYFCRWKIAGLGLLVTNCLALKFPVVLLLLSVIAGGIIAGGIIASVRQWLFWSPLIYHYITTFQTLDPS